jgi:hypothetical protein
MGKRRSRAHRQNGDWRARVHALTVFDRRQKECLMPAQSPQRFDE